MSCIAVQSNRDLGLYINQAKHDTQLKGLAFNIPGKRDEYWIGDYLVSLVSRTRLSSLCLQLHTIGTHCTYLSILLLLQIVDNCTECGSALRSTRVTQDRGRWIRPTSQHGRPLLLNALHFHQQYPHLDLDPKGRAPFKQFQIRPGWVGTIKTKDAIWL